MATSFLSYVLCKYPRMSKVKEFFVDLRTHPMHGSPYSTDLNKARTWTEPSGPHQYMLRHPELKASFFVLPVQTPARAVSRAEKRALNRPMPVRIFKGAHAMKRRALSHAK